jgi:hypothetical protein
MEALRAVFTGVLMLALTAGCAYDQGRDLPPIVERVTPAGARLLTACGGSSGLIEEPSHGCTFFARGDGATVTARVAQALRRDGFNVACRRPGEIAAVRGNVRVLAEVTQYGSVVAWGGIANVYPAGYRPRRSKPIPARSVALAIDASRLEASSASFWRQHVREGGRCNAPLPKPNLDEHCVNWWNGVGIPTAEAALRRRVLPPVEVRRRTGIARATCTYTLRTASGYLRVTARFERGDWVWPPLHRVDRPRSFRPNALLNEDGRLQLTS